MAIECHGRLLKGQMQQSTAKNDVLLKNTRVAAQEARTVGETSEECAQRERAGQGRAAAGRPGG